MIYDGMRFRKSNRIVLMHTEHGPILGRTCSQKKKGAIRTNYQWLGMSPYHDGPEIQIVGTIYPVYATPIVVDYYSEGNLIFDKDGYAYLVYDGKVYIHKVNRR